MLYCLQARDPTCYKRRPEKIRAETFYKLDFGEACDETLLIKNIPNYQEIFGWQRNRVQSDEAIESQHVLCKNGER